MFFDIHSILVIRHLSFVCFLETSVITEIQSDGSSLLVLEVRKNRILFLKTSLTRPSHLVMGKFDPTATDLGNLHLQDITTPLPIPGLDELTYEHNEYEYETNEEVSKLKDRHVYLILFPKFFNLWLINYRVFSKP